MPSPVPGTESASADQAPLMQVEGVHGAAAARERIARLRAGQDAGGPVDFSGLALIGEDLSGLDLRGANLVGADLSRCNLKDANLFGAQLGGATLFETDLSGAELSGADLEGANLEAAKLQRAGLGMARLAGASLTRAEMAEATLTEADLKGADLRLADLRHVRARNTDFTDADMTKSNCAEGEFDNSLFTGAILDSACLRAASISGVRGYKQASWIGVDMRDIDFTGAYLCRRYILDQNFIDEFRKQSLWTQVLYRLWSVTSDCGRSVTRWALCTCVIICAFAWIYTMVGVDFGAYETEISPLYFSVVTLTTLGYGDVLPSSVMGQVAAMCEVVTGYVMLGGLLSIFSNKMASRAD